MLGFGNKPAPIASSLLLKAQSERDARVRRIETAWLRYEGEFPDSLTVSKTDATGADNTHFNLARKTVDITAFYLFGKDIDFEVGDEDNPLVEADDWLEAAWQKNRQQTFLLELGIAAGVTGDAWVRLYPAVNGEKYPRIVSLDGQLVSVDTDTSDYTQVRRYVVQWNEVDTVTQQVWVRRTRVERDGAGWMIYEEESSEQKTVWTEVMPAQGWRYPFAPIFHAKNRPSPHCFYGRSDIEDDVLHLNERVNFVLSNINRILRIHGHPTPVITGQDKDGDIDKAVDGALFLPNPDAKITTLPVIDDLEAHFSQLKELVQAYHELTDVPEIATGKLESIGQLSGLALQILYGPLVQLVAIKRAFLGEMLVELCRAMLTLGNKGDDLPVTIHWPQIVPTDRTEEANTAVALNEAGVSQDTTLKELGYDADKEREKRANEAQTVGRQVVDQFNRGENADPQKGA